MTCLEDNVMTCLEDNVMTCFKKLFEYHIGANEKTRFSFICTQRLSVFRTKYFTKTTLSERYYTISNIAEVSIGWYNNDRLFSLPVSQLTSRQ